MKKNVFIASSAELKHERLELVDLLMDLTDARGVRFKSVLWEYMDSSMQEGRKEDEYLLRLKECDICFAMFWRTLGEYTVEEIDVAATEMQAGRCPKHVFVLFKKSDDISQELLEFKNNFSHNYPKIPYSIFSNISSLRTEVTHLLTNNL